LFSQPSSEAGRRVERGTKHEYEKKRRCADLGKLDKLLSCGTTAAVVKHFRGSICQDHVVNFNSKSATGQGISRSLDASLILHEVAQILNEP